MCVCDFFKVVKMTSLRGSNGNYIRDQADVAHRCKRHFESLINNNTQVNVFVLDEIPNFAQASDLDRDESSYRRNNKIDKPNKNRKKRRNRHPIFSNYEAKIW